MLNLVKWRCTREKTIRGKEVKINTRGLRRAGQDQRGGRKENEHAVGCFLGFRTSDVDCSALTVCGMGPVCNSRDREESMNVVSDFQAMWDRMMYTKLVGHGSREVPKNDQTVLPRLASFTCTRFILSLLLTLALLF